jgi:hypothetical protein
MAKTTAPVALKSGPTRHSWRSRCEADGVLFGLVLLWTFLACCFPLCDTDFWWHLRTGELIVERGELPAVDWFTFMDVDKPWIDLHWGFQLLITGLYHLGGSRLVVVIKAMLLTATVAIAWTATGRTLPTWLKTLFWIPAIIAISGRGYERPEVLTQFFLASWLWIIPRLTDRPRLIWLLPLIQVLWINCHSLFILGLVVGTCYVVDRIVREFAKGRWGLEVAPLEPDARLLMYAAIAVGLAAFCNPYFEQGALFPLVLYRKFSVEQDFYSVRIGEFAQPFGFFWKHGARAFANYYFVAELTIWILTAVSFIWLACYRRWNVMRVLLFAGFSHLAWEATRNTNIFAIVATTTLCANTQDILQLCKQFTTLPRPRLQIAIGASLVVLILSVVTGLWNALGEQNKPFGIGELYGTFPHAACLFAGQRGFPDHAFVAHNGFASTYSYHNGPGGRVFMDGRLEVCSRHTFELFDQIRFLMLRGDRSWEQLVPLDPAGRLPVVILDCKVSKPQIDGMLLTPGWRLVYADPIAAVFLEERLADKLSLPLVSSEPLLISNQPSLR